MTDSTTGIPVTSRRKGSSSHPRSHRSLPFTPSIQDKEVQHTLHTTFGITELRPGQQEVIENILQGKDTLAIMPTGAGKSLCYQLPALNIPGITVVVSPLISLMKDQASKLENAGVNASGINSTLSNREEEAALQSIREASSEFIFTTPERLSDPEFLATLKQNKVSLFVVDEAHCISHWGHDFRPAYLQIGAVINALGKPTVLALTATATNKVITDIRAQLGLPEIAIINTGIYRENLHYRVIPITDEAEKTAEIHRLVRELEGAGIIYTATVKAAEEVYQAIQQSGENVTCYHGQLPAKMRVKNQELFMSGACRVMVATNAFGMGIDKSDIRFVVHYQLPANLESYYQESGRAGRDGAPADCILLYYSKDKQIQQFFLARRYPGVDDLNSTYSALQLLSANHSSISFSQLHEALEQVPTNRLQVALKLLKDGALITQDTGLAYRILKQHVKPKELAQLVESYHEKSMRDHEALDRMVFYARTGFCRWKVILEYFGEQVAWSHCGSCDNCVSPPEETLSSQGTHQSISASTHAPASPTLKIGSVVKVAKFGEGKIISMTSDKCTIIFPNGETKQFVHAYVKPG